MTEGRAERWLVTSGKATLQVRVRRGTEDAVVDVEIAQDGAARILAASVLSYSDDTCVVAVEGRSTVVRLARHESGCHAMAGGEAFLVTSAAEERADSPDGAGPKATATSDGVDRDALCTPMPATVSAILVEPGQVVQAGDTLLRLEAMKMELAIRAPIDGRVKTVDCHAGDLVQPGRPLVGLDAQQSSSTDEGHEA